MDKMSKMTREVEITSLSVFIGEKFGIPDGKINLDWNHESSLRDSVATPAEAVQRIAEVLGVEITLGGQGE